MDPLEYAAKHNGMITTSEAERMGVFRARLSGYVVEGLLERVERGVYCLPDVWEDEYAICAKRFPRGILSHGTALYLHDLSDRTPERVTMTFPRTYNATSARKEGIVVRTCANNLASLGLSEVVTPSGNEVPCYDVERTLCDMLRGRADIDVQIVNPAMKAYTSSRRRNVGKLLDYARRLGVEKKIRNYLEVLL